MISFFLIGLFYDIEYRSMTRTLISNIADYNLEFYGAKQFRFFVPDFGFILTLIPLGIFIINKRQKLNRNPFFTIAVFSIFFFLYYFISCFIESEIIKYTTTINMGNTYRYHHSNINYRLIVLCSIIASLLSYNIFLSISKKAFK